MSNEDKKRRTLVVRPFSQAVNVPGSGCHGFNRSSKHTHGVHVSSYRRRFSLGGCSKVTEKSTVQTSRSTVRVFDEEGNDITPLQLYHFDQGILKATTNMFFLNEISAGSVSGHTTATGSFIMPFSRSVLGSSRISSQSTIESVNEETQDTFSKCDIPITFQATQPYEKQKINIVKKQVTEDMLKEYVEIFITETDTILLLDMYPTFVSVEVDNAESLIERNHWYTGICKTRTKNAKYVDRSMQTLNFATKSKQLQSYNTVMVEAATTVSYCDIHHSSEEDGKTNRPEIDYAEAILDANKSAERSLSVGSTSTYVSTSNSQKEVDVFKNWINNELDLNFILLSEKFQHSLLVMERNVLWNIFQYQLAAYRQFSLLKEPDGFKHPQQVEQEHGDKEVCQSPALECLWIFSCELCRGYCISSMGWNKKNPDLLAVGYGVFDSKNEKPGLVCCWSVKNPMWPEHIIQCESAVTSLDFSATCPSQLAVGMYDGSIAIYDLQSPNNKLGVINNCDCPNKHFGPVWQLRWNKQELKLIGEEKEETLFSVGADGRITKWFVLNGGLDCIDLMKLDKISNTKRKSGGNKTKETRKKILSAVTPGLCFDFHPTDYSNYLTGTWEGLIHRCSCSNSQQSLETYQKHFSAVNCVVWCPLHPGMFLSCGADWTIHLWHQDRLNPIICFTSAHRAVCDIKWSPQKATVFGVAYEGQLEIWDLSSNLLDPVIIEPAAPGVKMTSLMFASETDCIVVGDSDGHVTVYQIKNLGVGKRSQMDVLDNLLRSAFST